MLLSTRFEQEVLKKKKEDSEDKMLSFEGNGTKCFDLNGRG